MRAFLRQEITRTLIVAVVFVVFVALFSIALSKLISASKEFKKETDSFKNTFFLIYNKTSQFYSPETKKAVSELERFYISEKDTLSFLTQLENHIKDKGIEINSFVVSSEKRSEKNSLYKISFSLKSEKFEPLLSFLKDINNTPKFIYLSNISFAHKSSSFDEFSDRKNDYWILSGDLFFKVKP